MYECEIKHVILGCTTLYGYQKSLELLCEHWLKRIAAGRKYV